MITLTLTLTLTAIALGAFTAAGSTLAALALNAFFPTPPPKITELNH